jgi:hypothetical protein
MQAFATLAAKDFDGVKPPHVGLVYVWLIDMRVKDVLSEIERLLSGDRRSRQFNHDVGDGYVVAMLSAYPQASKMAAEGKGDTLIPLVYVGQEMRSALGMRFGRLAEAFTRSHSPCITELCLSRFGCICVPLASHLPTIQPPRAGNAALAAEISIENPEKFSDFSTALVLLLLYLGVLLLNRSPPNTPENSTYFDRRDSSPPQKESAVDGWIARCGSPALAAKLRANQVDTPWLKRALVAVELLHENSCYVMPDGSSAQRDLLLRSGSRVFSAFVR